MKKIMLPIAVVLLFAAACNSGEPKEMTPEEETQFVQEEAKAVDSSVAKVNEDVTTAEGEVDDLLNGI